MPADQLRLVESLPPAGRYEARLCDKGWVVFDTKLRRPVEFTECFDRERAERRAAEHNQAYQAGLA